MPSVLNVNTTSNVIKANASQFTGSAASNNGTAVTAMMADVINPWKPTDNAGITKIEVAGMPLILKLRYIPPSRASTTDL